MGEGESQWPERASWWQNGSCSTESRADVAASEDTNLKELIIPAGASPEGLTIIVTFLEYNLY